MKSFALLDFREGIVYVRDIPEALQNEQAEDIASYFEKELHVHLDDCQYMIADNMQVDDNTSL